MSALLIDAGNTRIKWRYQFSKGDHRRGGCAHADIGALAWPDVERVLVSSVLDNPELKSRLYDQFGQRLIWLSQPRADYPGFQHCYPKPERLGIDRWLAMIGARSHQGGDLVVVDAGTALTVDFFCQDDCHKGGFIVPGLTLAQQSLWQNTERVIPYPDETDTGALEPGQDTMQCVVSGVRRQQLGFIQHVLAERSGCHVFITGGDGRWLAEALGHDYWPELIFDGLDTLCAGYFLP